MEKNVCAGEVTDMKCMNVAVQNTKQSWKVHTGCAALVIVLLVTGGGFQKREKLRSSLIDNDNLDVLFSLFFFD